MSIVLWGKFYVTVSDGAEVLDSVWMEKKTEKLSSEKHKCVERKAGKEAEEGGDEVQLKWCYWCCSWWFSDPFGVFVVVLAVLAAV